MVGRAALFSGTLFLLTHLNGGDEDQERVRREVHAAGGGIIVLNAQGHPVLLEGRDQAEIDLASRRGSAGPGGGLLCDPSKGEPLKVTMKLLLGLALGVLPRPLTWFRACVRAGRITEPLATQQLRLPIPAAARPRGAAAAAAPRTPSGGPSPLLEGFVVVLLGSDMWRSATGWSLLLRTAGASTRTELPPSHHGGLETRRCVVLVEKDADASACRGLLERAAARGIPSASQEWVKQCLLQGRICDVQDYPVAVAKGAKQPKL